MSTTNSHDALRVAINLAGGQAALAKICGCSRANIHQSYSSGRGLPARYVNKVEEVLKIPRHVLRPDLYPLEREA